MNEPKLLPERFAERIDEQGRHRVICDYIAGMTDRFALEEHARLFDPAVRVPTGLWTGLVLGLLAFCWLLVRARTGSRRATESRR